MYYLIDNFAASTGAGYGMSVLEPQWLGKMNPFPIFIHKNPKLFSTSANIKDQT